MTELIEPDVWQDVASPFCGIAADDLRIKVTDNQLTILENADPITQKGFETPISDISPTIKGKPASLTQAINHIVTLLNASKQTLIGGVATDVNGARSVVALADKSRATIDNMVPAGITNTLVLQDTGWMTTTLTEVRNRMDVLLIVGTDIEAEYPRFFERMVWNPHSLFDQDNETRQIIYLGKVPSGTHSTSPGGNKAQVLACDPADLPEVLSVLRALLKGKRVQADRIAGIALTELMVLAETLQKARYSVITWAANQLDFAYPEMTVQTVCEMVKELNLTTRSNGLPLGGKEGSITANQVCAWQTGYPMRMHFNHGYPDYDPYLADGQRMLAENEVDTLLWIASFNCDHTPPRSNAKTIVLGRSGMGFAEGQQPEVFIPIGTPGIDHPGRTFRSDGVVAIPLTQLRNSGLPSTSEVLTAVEQAL